MSRELGAKIMEALARDLSQHKFTKRHNNVAENIIGIVKKSWNPLRRVFGGHGIAVVVVVPDMATDRSKLKTLFHNVRRDINSRFVGFAAYKSSYSFIVLVCPHNLFTACSGIASELKDRSGLHMNIIQGVILIDSETKEVAGDYTRPARHKREYEAVLAATRGAAK